MIKYLNFELILIMPIDFKENFDDYLSVFLSTLSTDDGDWTIKGFIDVFRNIYTISGDTKVISKLIELMIFPKILQFANENNYALQLSSYQNHYPDVTFIDRNPPHEKIALDIKSTYRLNNTEVNGMTLGAYSGYFRYRDSNKNITYPYNQYSKHYILGVLYSRTDMILAQQRMRNLGYTLNKTQLDKLDDYLSVSDEDHFKKFLDSLHVNIPEKCIEIKKELENCVIDERRQYRLEDLTQIISVVKDFDFFLQEKWKIAIDKPGSGNTRNIGSTKIINELTNGTGLFTRYTRGFDFFNDYWMHYMTNEDAKSARLVSPPYRDLPTYFAYRGIRHEE